MMYPLTATFVTTTLRLLAVGAFLAPPPLLGAEFTVDKQFARSGDEITLSGSGFAAPLELRIEGAIVAAEVTTVSSATFLLPDGPAGSLVVQLTGLADGATGSGYIPMFRLDSTTDYIAKNPEDLCAGLRYVDQSGTPQTGTKACFEGSSLPSQTLLTEVPAECSADGQSGCVTTEGFVAADTSNISGSDILSGVSVAGIAGTISQTPNPCSSAGETGCLATSNYPTQDRSNFDSSTTPVLSTNNDRNLLASDTAFSIWDKNGNQLTLRGDSDLIASNIRRNVGLLGVTGNLPDVSSPPCSTNGQQNCAPSGTFFATPPCTTNREKGCFLLSSSAFRSANLSELTAGNIKRGVTVAGQEGAFPSTDHPLPRYSTDDGTDSTESGSATPDLLSTTFDDQLKDNGPFEFWNSAGGRQNANGDADIAAANLSFTATIFGETGTLVGAQCTDATEEACLSDPACRWESGACEVNPWNLRVGITAAGQTGTIKTNCRNPIGPSYNSDTMPPDETATTVGSTDQWWDTADYDDVDGSTELPTTLPTGLADWTSANLCTRGLWQDVTADGACDADADDCIMKDLISNLYWTETVPGASSRPRNDYESWTAAMNRCGGLTYGGRSDWRLPTTYEMLQAYRHGLWELFARTGSTLSPGGDTLRNNPYYAEHDSQSPRYWTSTTTSYNIGRAWIIDFHRGGTNDVSKSDASDSASICVASGEVE